MDSDNLLQTAFYCFLSSGDVPFPVTASVLAVSTADEQCTSLLRLSQMQGRDWSKISFVVGLV